MTQNHILQDPPHFGVLLTREASLSAQTKCMNYTQPVGRQTGGKIDEGDLRIFTGVKRTMEYAWLMYHDVTTIEG